MAAGLGFKTFTTGEVLTAADTNGYLMQGINVFASTAARDAAITSPQEGQFAFTKDTNGLWYYDGAAWVASGATGDIDGVTAGIGISGGGTSGTVTITNSMATAIDATGDLVVGTGADTFSRLGVGTNGQVLTADSTVSPTGLKWSTVAAGATFVGCDLRKTANQSISDNTLTKVTFDSENYDTNGFHDNASNNTRITIPSGYAGKYIFSFMAQWASNSSGFRSLVFYLNNSEGPNIVRLANSGSGMVLNATVTLNLAVGDYVEMAAYQNSGGSLNLLFDGTTQTTAATRFGCTYLGA